jgi:hypothetical protein
MEIDNLDFATEAEDAATLICEMFELRDYKKTHYELVGIIDEMKRFCGDEFYNVANDWAKRVFELGFNQDKQAT